MGAEAGPAPIVDPKIFDWRLEPQLGSAFAAEARGALAGANAAIERSMRPLVALLRLSGPIAAAFDNQLRIAIGELDAEVARGPDRGIAGLESSVAATFADLVAQQAELPGGGSSPSGGLGTPQDAFSIADPLTGTFVTQDVFAEELEVIWDTLKRLQAGPEPPPPKPAPKAAA